LDRINYCYANPDFTGYDEIELINGTVIDRYTAPVRNEHGGFYGRIWSFRDVTEQKRAQRLEAETLERLRKISSRLPGVVFQFRIRPDGSSCFPYASEGLYELYRVRPEDVVDDASAVFACIHPDDVDGLVASINKSSKDLSPFKCDFRLLFVDGTMRWVAANSLPERDSDGTTQWYGYMEDATTAHESATELHDAKLRLEEAQALARIGNWTYDVSTMKSCWSKQLYHIFGFEKSEIAPNYQQMLDLFYPEDAVRLDQAIKTASIDGSSYSVAVRMLHPQSDVRYVRCEGRSRQDTAGKIVSLYGTAADVTAEVEREQTLQFARDQADAANLAKSEFLANMSHEIRTPLTAILGFADMLREEVNFDVASDHRLHTINTITNAGQHLLAIINDVLDLSKIESGKLSTELIETPLIEVLCQVERILQPKAIGKGLKLNVELSTPVPDRILCDPTRLRQILMNLVGNAVKFTEQGTIDINASVTASAANTSLVIDIEDTGPGMTAKQSQTLFNAFSQADNTVTRIHGGTGLGLTISRRLANLMGGDVTLQRTGVGQGSCFRLVLPLIPATKSSIVDRLKTQAVSPVHSPISKIQVRGRILFAEDGPDNQHLISFHLKKAGATIDIADNGQVALELLDIANESNISYDLLLTDMQMPVMDGYILARTLRSRGIKIPIIALTAYNLSEDRQKCLDAGCDDYLSKPIDKNSLLAVCAKWITVRR
jgi:signal transduction histidine kinase/ActR/RegA family two-component response regulator